MSYALAGVHVLDLTWVGVGPIATKYMADNGAEVIKLESAGHIDVLRMAPPFQEGRPGPNRSQFFASYNTSKKSLTLNLGHPKARALALELVGWADVVAENFTPGTMDKWGLGYPALSARKPELIMLSSCLQGQTGPRAKMAGFGQLLSALAGFYYSAGYPGGDSRPPYGAYTDYVAPRLAACAILAALDYRRRTGRGQLIDLSQFEASLHFLAPALVDYFATGRVLEPCGNQSSRFAPHGAYRCRDVAGAERWLAIALQDDHQWQALLAALGHPDADSKWQTAAYRLAHQAELDDLMASWTRQHDADQLTAALQAAGLAAYPVQSCADLHRDSNLAAFGFWQTLDHPEMGKVDYEGLQHHLSRTPGALRSPAPTLGQHTEEVLREVLGLSPEEIAALRQDGVLV